MRKVILIVLCLFCFINVNAQDELIKEHKEVIADFISYLKNNDRQKLASLVAYPLKREYPLSEIKDKDEFLKRFDEVFDAKLIAMIVNSNSFKDWTEMGWRGIMFLQGDIWLDEEGKLIGVNYQSEDEAKKMAKLIAREKETVHPSLRVFYKPVSVLLTKKYRIRIDNMGGDKYRYASWKINAKKSDKPDLIIESVIIFMHSKDYYTFTNGRYVYKCGINQLDEDDSSPSLIIYKDGKEILSQPATIELP